MKVTAKTITDEQIRNLVRSTTDRELISIGTSALNPLCHEPRRTEARARCAAVYYAARANAAFDLAMAQAALEHNLRGGRS